MKRMNRLPFNRMTTKSLSLRCEVRNSPVWRLPRANYNLLVPDACRVASVATLPRGSIEAPDSEWRSRPIPGDHRIYFGDSAPGQLSIAMLQSIYESSATVVRILWVVRILRFVWALIPLPILQSPYNLDCCRAHKQA